MGRYRLYAALLLLGFGLIGWCGAMAAPGMGNGSPFPPPAVDGADRSVIASGQPVNNTARAVVRVSDATVSDSTNPGANVSNPDPAVPAIPRLQGVTPVVPIPDDGLFSRFKLRRLPPPVETLSSPPPSEITIPPAQQPETFIIRAVPPPAAAPRTHPGYYEESDAPLDPAHARETSNTSRLVNKSPAPVLERAESANGFASPVGAQTSIVSLEVVGPATVNRGQAFVYEIVVRNNGSTPAFRVEVEETLQQGVRCLGAAPQATAQGSRLSWNLGTLAAGAEQRYRLEIQPPADGEVVSSAHATFTTSSSLHTRITRPQLTLTQSAPEGVQVGDEVAIRLDVKNTGSGPATHVIVRDQLPAGLRHPAGAEIESEVGTLGAGETKTLVLRAQAVRTGKLINEAAATGDDCQTVAAQAAVTVTQAKLALRESSPRNGMVNQEMEYRLEVASTGSAAATNVQVTDVLPQGLDFISASEGGVYSAAPRAVSWNVGDLAPGRTRTVAFRAQVRTAGEFVHQAAAVADRNVEAKAAGAVRVEGVAALTLTVAATETLLEVNAETTYEIRVMNQGSGSSSNIRIVVAAPEGLILVKADGPSVSHVQGEQVLFDPVPQLAARGELVFRVHAKGRRPGDWRLKAQLTSDQLQRPVIKEETTRVYGD